MGTIDQNTQGATSGWGDRHPSVAHFEELFSFNHLPEHLAGVSAPVAVLAEHLVAILGDGQELSAGLRKLVEAKDCFVRQAVKDHRAATRGESSS
jgi:hypothetical protein